MCTSAYPVDGQRADDGGLCSTLECLCQHLLQPILHRAPVSVPTRRTQFGEEGCNCLQAETLAMPTSRSAAMSVFGVEPAPTNSGRL